MPRTLSPNRPAVTEYSYPCDCGTCPTFIYSGSFCSGCLVHCDVDLLFPQTPEHDALTQAAAERFLNEVA